MEKGNSTLHFFDRYFGIPILGLLSQFKLVKNQFPNNFSPKRIAILNISSIGDTVLMSAPIQDLKLAYPEVEIEVFCGSTNVGVLGMVSFISKIHKLPVTNVFESVSEIRKAGEFELVIDFGPWPRLNAIFAYFFKAKYSIGFKSKKQFRHFCYDYAVVHSEQNHELDNFRTLLSPLTIETKSKPFLNLSSKTNSISESNYILFHPWPGGYKSYMKEWSKENWLVLAKRLSDLDYKIYITGAKADVEMSDELVKQSNGTLHSIAGLHNLSETATIVHNAKLLVSVNTGIMHIGAALDTKMVALHGPTSVKRWGPVSPNAVNIFPKNSECGYLHFGYEYNKSTVNCMDLISVEEVYEAVLGQLK
jgi:ADP-heptose:LPS heptosyltransferase